MIQYISHCRLYNDPRQRVHLAVENGKIRHVDYCLPDHAEIIYSAQDQIVAPGLIDTHVHGCGGADPRDAKGESLDTMASSLCQLGTTTFCATTFYNAHKSNSHLSLISERRNGDARSECAGIHLEGPFISLKRKGGIPESCVIAPNENILEGILNICGDRLKIMTLAPELKGSGSLISELISAGVCVSFGHSDADCSQALSGFEQGMDLVTHIGNAMRPFHHRDAGPLAAVLESDAMIQIIADGVHLSDETIRFFASVFGTDRLVCITDGIHSTGLPDGEYDFQGKAFISENGKAYYRENGGLIGTSLPLFEIMKRFKDFTGCSLSRAVDTASLNPAKVLGLDHKKGKICSGYDADLIFMDDSLNLKTVMKNGFIV